MITLRVDQAAQMAGGTLVTPKKAAEIFAGVSIDSRTLRQGELFIALRGERTDGHKYLEQAVAKGAAGLIVETQYESAQAAVIRVHDSHEAMMLLASRYRDLSHAKFIGITGSNGKTTTKEMAFALLSAVDSDIYRSSGNLNNLYGLPLALFAMPQATHVAVMEMGISTPGEMTRLAAIIRPDLAVITSVAATHLEFLGSVEGVARAKLELVTNASADVPVIINADNAVLVNETKKHREHVITFGIENPATYRPDRVQVGADGVTDVGIDGHTFRLPLFGQHQVYNLLAAYAAVRTLGHDFRDVDTATIAFTTAPMRGQRIVEREVTFIVDCYNANPESVRLGLKSFESLKHSGRRILILGDMLELGEQAEEYHRALGHALAQYAADVIALVGPLSKLTADSALSAGIKSERVHHYTDAQTCAAEINTLLTAGDLVYLKGSRGIGLENVLDAFAGKGGIH